MNEGGTDWGQIVMVGNEIGQQWYALITGKTLPTQEGVSVGPSGARIVAGTNTTIVIVAVVLVAGLLLWKK